LSLQAISEHIIQVVEAKVDINIMLKNDAPAADVNNLKIFLGNIEDVAEVKYVSREEVLEAFKIQNIDNPDITEALGELSDNPFNNALIVKAKDAQSYENLIREINSSEYVDIIDNNDFSDPQKIISFVRDSSAKMEAFGMGLAIIFGVIALLIVFNTIRMAIYTHKEEIGVMRLVGATNWFIRGPYVVEGVLFGVVSAAITIGLVYFILNLLSPLMTSFLGGYTVDLIGYFNQHCLIIFGGEMLGAVILTMVSSGIAMRRYLRV
jgi:cell division transport system permease protein